MSTSVKAADLSITIVVAILKMAGLGPEADRLLDAIEGAKNCINLIDDIKNETVSDPNKELIRSLFKAIKEEIDSIKADLKDQGLGKDEIESTADALIETTRLTVKQLAQNDDALLNAARLPDSFFNILVHRAEPLPDWCDDAIGKLYEQLLKRVSAEFIERNKDSDRFDKVALASLLRDNLSAKKQRNRIERGVQENRAINLETNGVVKEDRATGLETNRVVKEHQATGLETNQLVKELVQRHPYSIPSRLIFGSRPDVVAGDRFVPRAEQDKLNSVITNPKQRRTVLVGMSGCGKTQLASALAQQCEENHWSLVAWVNSGSTESIKRDLVELATELEIPTSDQPSQETLIGRCRNHLQSAEASDRLIIFDNVKNIDDLRELVPSGAKLRVVATTTNNTGWDDKGWDTIEVSMFDHNKSIDHLLTVTSSTDYDAAHTLALRLGDLPLAITQAACVCKRLNISLSKFNDLLNNQPIEKVLNHTSKTEDHKDIVNTIIETHHLVFERIKDNKVAHIATCILQALCYLSESGVPTYWLTDEEVIESLDAYAILVESSLIQQSHDREVTILHPLYSYSFRKLFSRNNENLTALQTAAYCLQYGASLAWDETEPTKQVLMVKDFERQLLNCIIQDHSKGILCSKGVHEAMDALLHIQIQHRKEFADLEDIARNAMKELSINWDWNDPAHYYKLE